jgi:negative regulator of flagellin synthesis FlgM
MNIRTDIEGLKSILGASPETSSISQAKSGAVTGDNALTSDQATLSSAASAVLESSADGGVRADKVAAVQAALANGSYNVSASAVASKVVDAMLGDGIKG